MTIQSNRLPFAYNEVGDYRSAHPMSVPASFSPTCFRYRGRKQNWLLEPVITQGRAPQKGPLRGAEVSVADVLKFLTVFSLSLHLSEVPWDQRTCPGVLEPWLTSYFLLHHEPVLSHLLHTPSTCNWGPGHRYGAVSAGALSLGAGPGHQRESVCTS